MSWLSSLYSQLLYSAVTGFALTSLASVAVLLAREPARKIRLIQLALVGLVAVPLLALVPGYPRLISPQSETVAMSRAGEAPAEPNLDREGESPGEPAHRVVTQVPDAPNRTWEADAPAELAQEREGEAPAEPTQTRERVASVDPTPSRISEANSELSAESLAPRALESAPATSPEIASFIAPSDEGIAPGDAGITRAPLDYRLWIVAAYLAGVAAMVAWSLVGLLAARRLLATARPADAACRAILRELAGQSSEQTALVVSPHARQPCVLAWRPTTIVLPQYLVADQSHAGRRQLRWTLAHEWSHVAGGDVWLWGTTSIVRWFYFYQPLMWFLRRQLQLSQDYLADAAAAPSASEATTPEDYAEFLTTYAGRQGAQLAVGLGIFTRGTDLERRVVMLVERERPLERTVPRGWTLAAIALAVLLFATIAALRERPAAVAAALDEDSQSQAQPPAESGPVDALTPPATATSPWPQQPSGNGPTVSPNLNLLQTLQEQRRDGTPSQVEVYTPARIAIWDVLRISVTGTWPGFPIDGKFLVESDGTILLGPKYGRFHVHNLTPEAVADQFPSRIGNAIATVSTLGPAVWESGQAPAIPYRVGPGSMLTITAVDNYGDIKECVCKVADDGTCRVEGFGLPADSQTTPSLAGRTIHAAENVVRTWLHDFQAYKNMQGATASVAIAGWKAAPPEEPRLSLTIAPTPREAPPNASQPAGQSQRPGDAQPPVDEDLWKMPGDIRLRPLNTVEISVSLKPQVHKELSKDGKWVEVMGELMPVSGMYVIEPDGDVALPHGYGRVRVKDLSPAQAGEAIRQRLTEKLQPRMVLPPVSVSKRGKAVFPADRTPPVDGYRIRPGDQLLIGGDMHQALNYTVDSDGNLEKLSYPAYPNSITWTGLSNRRSVHVAGLTLAEADDLIRKEEERVAESSRLAGKVAWPGFTLYLTLGGWTEEANPRRFEDSPSRMIERLERQLDELKRGGMR